ncbi:MAG: phospho-N-acetylmuramoyl-pentapeptide-transferase [Spirochaetia bacterium]|nr:phospho-N-acetylmuramoyl-pentapeptide-transferase [Spirochaetia bacterium]
MMVLLLRAEMSQFVIQRGLAAFAGAWIITRLIANPFIHFSLRQNLGQFIRAEGPESHNSKKGTPTMGGLVFIAGLLIVSLFLVDWLQARMLPLLLGMVLFGLVGFIDDRKKQLRKNSGGLSAAGKILLQALAAAVVLISIESTSVTDPTLLYLPWMAGAAVELGGWYYPLAGIFILFFVNSVNLSDGLDGLAGGLVILLIVFLVILLQMGMGTADAADKYFRSEFIVLLLGLAGCLFGFLQLNMKPAKVFMGDVGSQSLGGILAVSAIMLHAELLVLAAGAVFLAETLSVILQVASFKIFGKRIFRMAPLHHHFELKGMAEKRIVVGFWAAGVVSTCCAFIMYAFFLR